MRVARSDRGRPTSGGQNGLPGCPAAWGGDLAKPNLRAELFDNLACGQADLSCLCWGLSIRSAGEAEGVTGDVASIRRDEYSDHDGLNFISGAGAERGVQRASGRAGSGR